MASSAPTAQLFLYSRSFATGAVQQLIPASPISVRIPHEHEFYDWMASRIAEIPLSRALRFQEVFNLGWEPIPHVDDLVPFAVLIGLYPFEINGEVLRRLDWAINYRRDLSRDYVSNRELYKQYTHRTQELALAYNILMLVNGVRAHWADDELRQKVKPLRLEIQKLRRQNRASKRRTAELVDNLKEQFDMRLHEFRSMLRSTKELCSRVSAEFKTLGMKTSENFDGHVEDDLKALNTDADRLKTWSNIFESRLGFQLLLESRRNRLL